MTTRDVAVFSRRHPIKAGLELLLECRLDDGSEWIWPLTDAFAGGQHLPRLIVVDVLRLLSSEVAYLPRLTSASPNMLVVGLPEDSRALIAAWNEGMPAYPLEDLKPEMLVRMLARSDGGCEFHDYLGRRGAEKVHSFLARRLECQILTDRETMVVDLLRFGWRNARIASYLGIDTKTVKNHITHVKQKLGASSRYEILARTAEPASEIRYPARPSPSRR